MDPTLADRDRDLAYVAVERTRMAMTVVDATKPDLPIVMANQAFLDLTGYAADEVVGRNCRFLQGPLTSPAAVQEIRDALAERRATLVEFVNYRKDGSSFLNQLAISPIEDAEGRLIYYFGSQLDVTDLRRTEELEASEHRLLREVDHRAMNALALAQAIVRLSRTDSVERYSELVQGRIGALARAHVILAQNGWTGVGMDALLRGELEVSLSGDWSVDGETVQVSASQVQPLMLVMHEMVDDLSRRHRRAPIRLSAASRADPATGWIGFDWRESGGPPGVAPEFESGLIKTLVERQLKGRLIWREGLEGLEAELRAPPR